MGKTKSHPKRNELNENRIYKIKISAS